MTNGYNIFVYGTLLLPPVMEAVTGRSYEGIPATLEGYRRCRVKDEVFPAVVEDRKSSLKGKLYLDLDARTLRALDAFEGDLFDRRLLPVETENGDRFQAYVYVVPAWNSAQLLVDEPWSLKTFMQNDYDAFLADIDG